MEETNLPTAGKIRLFCLYVMNASNPIIKVFIVSNYSDPHSAKSFYTTCCAAWNHESVCRCCRQSHTCLIFSLHFGSLSVGYSLPST
jgi:hypothetical protein